MAADSITFTTPIRHTQEGSTLVVTARFRNRASAIDVTPTNVRYRLTCLSSGAQLLDWTAATASASVSFTITSTQNAMQNGTSKIERKQITVASDYGLTTEYRDSFIWDTKRIT